MTVRVLIADDQVIVRDGLRLLLDAQPDFEVVATAADGDQAVELAHQHRPDVCLLDIRMPVLDGLEATRQLAGNDIADPLAVVILTTFDDDELVHQALQAGARGFVLKDTDTDLLLHAIRAAAQGDALIAPAITARLLARFASTAQSSAPPQVELSERERQILVAIARGDTNAEIADDLFLSLSSVKSCIGVLMDKIGARNRVHVAIWAYQAGLAHD
ncbi:MAG: response regulator transcription factor [Ilumatobacteraceae bacterium]